jgi:predicted regulator of Ras-like GTPase activity (Roadblock/LC7/MglB family)
MANIRDLVAVIRQRDGVECAVVLGRDGLVIDGQAIAGLDIETVSAFVPPILQGADEFGEGSSRGPLQMAVLEHPGGFAILAPLSAEGVLLVLVKAGASIGGLLFELRRHREHMSSLV